MRAFSKGSVRSKQLEAMVGNWIIGYVRGKLDNRQYGSLKGRSTTHALIDMVHHWSNAFDDGNSVRSVFCGLSATLRRLIMHRNSVLKKLAAYGVQEFITKWTSSFLINRQQRVKTADVLSDWLTLRGGIPQGYWLGSLIFLTIIDDLHSQLLTHKYVDDTTVYEILARGEVSWLQSALDELIAWSDSNYMNTNCSKAKKMILSPLNKQQPFSPVILGS